MKKFMYNNIVKLVVCSIWHYLNNSVIIVLVLVVLYWLWNLQLTI